LRLLQRQLACLDLGEAALRGVLEEIAVPAIASGPLGLLARHRRGNLGAGCLGPARGLSARSGLGECARGGEGRAERDEGNGWESFHVASLPRVRYANGRYPTPARAAPASNRSRIAADSGCSSMVERQLPKLHTRVRFPSPAPLHHSADFRRSPRESASRCHTRTFPLFDVLPRSTAIRLQSGLLSPQTSPFLRARLIPDC